MWGGWPRTGSSFGGRAKSRLWRATWCGSRWEGPAPTSLDFLATWTGGISTPGCLKSPSEEAMSLGVMRSDPPSTPRGGRRVRGPSFTCSGLRGQVAGPGWGAESVEQGLAGAPVGDRLQGPRSPGRGRKRQLASHSPIHQQICSVSSQGIHRLLPGTQAAPRGLPDRTSSVTVRAGAREEGQLGLPEAGQRGKGLPPRASPWNRMGCGWGGLQAQEGGLTEAEDFFII